MKRKITNGESLPPSSTTTKELEVYPWGIATGFTAGVLTGIILSAHFNILYSLHAIVPLLLYAAAGSVTLGIAIREYDSGSPTVDIEREIASDSFSYGNHNIHTTVKIVHESKEAIQTDYDGSVLNTESDIDDDEYYFRLVTVEARNPDKGDVEITNTTAVPLDSDTHHTKAESETELIDQTKTTGETVFNELDYVYEYTDDTGVETDVALELMSESVSWIETDEIETNKNERVEKDSELSDTHE